MATRARTIGQTAGGKGRIPGNVRTQSDYYKSGRSSAFNPGGVVRDASGNATNRSGKS